MIDRAIVREQIVARELLDDPAEADRRERVRVSRVHVGEQRVECELEWIVGARAQLAENQSPRRLDGVGGESRLQRDVGEQCEHRLPVPRERRAADLAVLDVAAGVDASAEIFRRRRELDVRPVRRAARHRTLQEIRDAGGLGRLEARARADEQRRRDHTGRGILANEHAEPVRQCGAGDVRGIRPRASRGREQQEDDEDDRACHRGGTNVTRT